MTIDKDRIILEWLQQSPYLTNVLLFDFLCEDPNSIAVMPVLTDELIEAYLDGSKLKRYDFMLSVMYELSDSTDSTNTDNRLSLRQWQDWLEEQELEASYPDFGESCSCYEWRQLGDPSLATVYTEGNTAKYQLPATLVYREE